MIYTITLLLIALVLQQDHTMDFIVLEDIKKVLKNCTLFQSNQLILILKHLKCWLQEG
jgi:hypothetical protein